MLDDWLLPFRTLQKFTLQVGFGDYIPPIYVITEDKSED